MKRPLGIVFLLAYSFYAVGVFTFRIYSESRNHLSNFAMLALWICLMVGLVRMEKWTWFIALFMAVAGMFAAGYMLWLLEGPSGSFTSYVWKIELRNLLIYVMLTVYLFEAQVRQAFFARRAAEQNAADNSNQA